MRNTLLILFLLAFGAAWAADPLVGPGKVGEKDEKGHVKGVDSGAGPHKHFNQQQFERRTDEPAQNEAGKSGAGSTAPEKKPEAKKDLPEKK